MLKIRTAYLRGSKLFLYFMRKFFIYYYTIIIDNICDSFMTRYKIKAICNSIFYI